MSLYKYSFWEVLKHSFSAEVWDKVMPAIGETMYMVAEIGRASCRERV